MVLIKKFILQIRFLKWECTSLWGTRKVPRASIPNMIQPALQSGVNLQLPGTKGLVFEGCFPVQCSREKMTGWDRRLVVQSLNRVLHFVDTCPWKSTCLSPQYLKVCNELPEWRTVKRRTAASQLCSRLSFAAWHSSPHETLKLRKVPGFPSPLCPGVQDPKPAVSALPGTVSKCWLLFSNILPYLYFCLHGPVELVVLMFSVTGF